MQIKIGEIFKYLFQKILLFRLLSTQAQIKTYEATLLPVLLYGRKTSFLTRKEENRLRMCETMMLTLIFGLEK
jgi:hypothetical protein